VQQWVGLMNEFMNVNSWMVLESNQCYQEMANEKLGVATEPSPESLRGAFPLCSGGWHSEIWTNITVL